MFTRNDFTGWLNRFRHNERNSDPRKQQSQSGKRTETRIFRQFQRRLRRHNLNYKLFPDSPADKFDNLVLRADYNSSWTHWDGSNQRPKGTRQRDAFCKDLFRGMGDVAGHHRYVNLFIDGIYWGTYDITEKESDTFGAAYFGGDSSDYDVYEQGQLKSGTSTAYSAMTSIASPIDNTKYELMKQYLDIPEFADYMLLHFYVGHQDWGDDPNKNWYAVRNRTKNGTFKYLPWDQENLLWDPSVNRTGVSNPPSGLHTKLVTNSSTNLILRTASKSTW